jgi:hypothetical protein
MAPGRAAGTLLLALVAGNGCERKAAGSDRAADTVGAAASVDSTVVRHFRAFEQGNIAAWSSILADEVFFTAAGPGDVFDRRETARDKMEQDIERVQASGIRLTIQPLSHWTWVAEHGRTAATTYDLDYRILFQDQSVSYRLRSTYLLERDSSAWRVLAAQYSRPILYDTLFMALVRRTVSSPAPLKGQVPPEAEPIVRRFRSDIREIGSAALDRDVTVVSPGAIVHGADNGRRELAMWLGPVGSVSGQGDGVRAGLDASGTVGWVAAILRVPVFAGPESAVAPMRALFMYRRAGDQWEIVQATLSVGLRDGS